MTDRVETIPILPSADFDATSAFWALFGFDEIGRWPQEYLIVRHQAMAIELHFWHDPTVDRWTNSVGCYVRFPTPAACLACHAGWAGIVVPEPATFSPPTHGPGPGSVEFHIIDIHGNLVRLGGFPPT